MNPHMLSTTPVTSQDINTTTNNRIYNRNLPSAPLQPYFSTRATPTKYTKMMTTTPPISSNVPLQSNIPVYNTTTTFSPANRSAPWSGFASNVDVESDMRNQFYALQSCPQSAYIPDSSSDLYTLRAFAHKEKPSHKSHPLLFATDTFSAFNPNIGNTSKATFNNHTRQDIKNVVV